MKNFDYQTPTRLIFGRDVVAGLPEVMRPFGRRILLTYGGGSIKRIGLYDRVKELLKDFEIFELGGIEPNPKYSTSVVEGVRICKEQQIDVILSVGGGSVLDCSKAIAGGAKYDGETWDLIIGKAPTLAALPIEIIREKPLLFKSQRLSFIISWMVYPFLAVLLYFMITHRHWLKII